MLCTVTDGTQFHFGRTGWYTYHHAQRWGEEMTTAICHLYQTSHHQFTRIEIGNDTIAKWTTSTNIIMRLLVHHLGFGAYGNHLIAIFIHSHNRWFVNHNLTIAGNDGVGGAKVHGYVLSQRKESHILLFILRNTGGWLCRSGCSHRMLSLQKSCAVPLS